MLNYIDKEADIDILDYWAWDGVFSLFLPVNYRYHYLDIATSQYKNIRKENSTLHIFKDNYTLPDFGKKFDVIVMSEIIEHLPDVYSVISTLKQQLKPGWRIVVTTPNAFYWMNVIKGFFWRYIDPSKQHVNLYDYSTLNNIFELAWYSLADKRFLIFSYLVFNKCKRIDSLLSRLFKYSNLNLFLVFENKI